MLAALEFRSALKYAQSQEILDRFTLPLWNFGVQLIHFRNNTLQPISHFPFKHHSPNPVRLLAPRGKLLRRAINGSLLRPRGDLRI